MGDDVVAAARQASLLFHAGRFDEALAVLADVKQRRSDDPKARPRVARTRRQSAAPARRHGGCRRSEKWPAASRLPAVASRPGVGADARRRRVRR